MHSNTTYTTGQRSEVAATHWGRGCADAAGSKAPGTTFDFMPAVDRVDPALGVATSLEHAGPYRPSLSWGTAQKVSAAQFGRRRAASLACLLIGRQKGVRARV